MRIAIGGFFHESNTFCRPFTELADYERTRLYRGAEMLPPLRGTDTEIGGFLRAADELGFEVVPTYYAWAWPAGPLTDDCFRTILDRLKQEMEAAMPVDGVLLQLHGAMVTQSDDDPDGTILAEVRSCLPPGVPLVATFDFHSNLSPLMVSSCDALIGYDTYPHVDLNDRGREAAGLIVRMINGEVRPVMALAKPPLMPHIVRQRTAEGPMAEMMALARDAEEEPGVLRVSVAGGFAYADVPRMGMGILTITDGDEQLAADLAEELAEQAWVRRERFTETLPDADEAVRLALACHSGHGPVVLADVADNVGGGSPGDGTVLLQALLHHRAKDAVILIADPEAVRACLQAGVRERVTVPVGGKVDRMHGDPVTVTGTVRALTDGIFRNIGPMRDGLVDDQGRTAVVDVDGLTLVITERKLPMWNLQQLRSCGIEPAEQRIIVCKGAIAHRAAYAPIAGRMIEVETPGSCSGDVRRFPYENIRRPLFPIDRW
ncbi:MAG: MlrC domain protein [Armatimonadetes bacterium]|jgi:microcystin degradation protein MlrC|nr:MlrC domain protein [Armatimonadota bacterium]